MSENIIKCPNCKSSCLYYKPDGTILCTACMNKIIKKQEEEKVCTNHQAKK